jgi:AraC-like DNA-binding protein
MEKIERYIKMPKQFVRQNMTTKDKKGLIITYLYFHTTIDNEVYTTIDCICSELNMSTKSHGTRRNQNVVKDILLELINENIISFISTKECPELNTVANSQLFKIKLNSESDMFTSTSKYVRIEKSEYDKIISINSNKTNKIFNIFYQIKSHVCMDNNCLHICYPSMKTLCENCGCSDNTLAEIFKMLNQQNMLYIYKLGDQEKISINRNIEYIFSLERYSKESMLNEFVA